MKTNEELKKEAELEIIAVKEYNRKDNIKNLLRDIEHYKICIGKIQKELNDLLKSELE